MGKHDETSVWKKEISFRKKPKQAPKAEPVWPQEAAHAASAAPDAKSSVWKKEIGFGRKGKPKPPKPVSLPPVEAPPLPPAAATALLRHVGTTDTAELEVPGGHVGAVVGSKAATQMYPGLIKWLAPSSVLASRKWG